MRSSDWPTGFCTDFWQNLLQYTDLCRMSLGFTVFWPWVNEFWQLWTCRFRNLLATGPHEQNDGIIAAAHLDRLLWGL